ncbi:MAG: AAA family ATPase [Sciscionella sp.]
MSSVPIAANAGYYAEIVRDRSLRRDADQIARRIHEAVQLTTTSPDDLDAVLAKLRGELDGLGSVQMPFMGAAEALEAELLDSDALDTIPALRPLVDGFLYLDTTARINGQSGHMKSFVVLDIAAHVGTGQPWRGHPVTQGLVIYLVAEGAAGLRKRVRVWEQHHHQRMNYVRFLPRPVQAGDEAAWAVLIETCRHLQPVLIIFDTQARITVGVEENSATEMGRIVARIEALRTATGACVTLVHHQGLQGDHGRGSTAMKGAMQTELRVTKKGTGPETRVVVTSDKQKDDEELADVVFAVQVVKLDHEAKEDGSPVTSVVLVPADDLAEEPEQPRRSPAVEKVLAALQTTDGALTSLEIGDVIAEKHGTGLRRETMSKALNDLAREGLVDRVDDEHRKRVYWTLRPRSEEV